MRTVVITRTALPHSTQPENSMSGGRQPVGTRTSALHRPRGEAGDEAVHEQVVEERDGDAGDEAGGHEGAPEVHVAADQEAGDADADGEVLRAGDEGQGVDELLQDEG